MNYEQSKSTDKLVILMDGLTKCFSEEKIREADYFEISWQELDGCDVVAPKVIISFRKEKDQSEYDRVAKLSEELKKLSKKYDIAFSMPPQQSKESDLFSSLNCFIPIPAYPRTSPKIRGEIFINGEIRSVSLWNNVTSKPNTICYDDALILSTIDQYVGLDYKVTYSKPSGITGTISNNQIAVEIEDKMSITVELTSGCV